MKKILLFFVAISITLGGMAQKGKVTSALSLIDQGDLEKAKTALDEALVHPKTKDFANTYFALGKLAQAVYDSKDSKYSSYFKDPLAESYAAYQKALALDPKKTTSNRILTSMSYNLLVISFGDQGVSKFQEGDYSSALESFSTQIEIMGSDFYVGAIDTGIYYNAGLAALSAQKYEEGAKYFQKCIDYNYMGITPHFQLAECYTGMGQPDKAEQYLLDLPKLYPDDKNIVLSLIDMYIKNNQFEKAIQYIDIAKADDPTNYSLYYAAGIMYLNQNYFDEAIENLTKAHELNATSFDTNYGLGAAYINYGGDIFLKANDIIDINEYNEAVEEANTQYMKALPFLEKALEYDPDNLDVMRSLQELYFRLRQKDESLNIKYQEIRAKIQSLE
ncbi:MAG: tetratricopeptide repeat protein [Bacteroidales bacterium]|jgi:tetratricopeptide (TPR) repeat protein